MDHNCQAINQVTETKSNRFIDRFVYVVAFVGPIMTLPQLKVVWIDRLVEGLSLWSWGTYFLLSAFWLYYGISRKDKAIIFSQILWLLLYASVIVGIVYFKY